MNAIDGISFHFSVRKKKRKTYVAGSSQEFNFGNHLLDVMECGGSDRVFLALDRSRQS